MLDAYLPHAHTRLEGFADCALEEGRYFATVPRNEEEERLYLKRKVRQEIDDRASQAQGEIWDEIEPELARLRYQQEIAQRLFDKAQDEAARQTWQTQVDALQVLIAQQERRLAEQQAEVDLCDAMVAEIDADLGVEQEAQKE